MGGSWAYPAAYAANDRAQPWLNGTAPPTAMCELPCVPDAGMGGRRPRGPVADAVADMPSDAECMDAEPPYGPMADAADSTVRELDLPASTEREGGSNPYALWGYRPIPYVSLM